jgi:hypothetical protein
MVYSLVARLVRLLPQSGGAPLMAVRYRAPFLRSSLIIATTVPVWLKASENYYLNGLTCHSLAGLF